MTFLAGSNAMRLRQSLIILLLFFPPFSAAAHVSTPTEKTERLHNVANSIAGRGGPSVAISGASLSINGTTVWLGGTISSWMKVLPSEPRCTKAGTSITTCIWDEFGITVGSDRRDLTKVKFVNIQLGWDESDQMLGRSSSSPAKLFQGRLTLDGFTFDSTTSFRDIGMRADKRRELRCGGHYCGHPWGRFSSAANLSFWLDSGDDLGHVTELSISCVDTDACRALIPKTTLRPH
ncbi:hypothetical protein G4G28_11150 [Massilia sp. Dwa41.01b]|uniref:DUF7738 domain-containing protein n=1 Tax=unclassified Massilia TaxID=2609279 RepID=UPI0016001EED|nr:MULTISPECIES: hypothetical protein [unclassified Massilia]QNA88905.1 hypothetical protein G4G28_11150 [Massilia sp. Dwa41.01b]QNA99795.1 hypothetical protein G4G31_14780 [Massilia sp. Se16.2.3]